MNVILLLVLGVLVFAVVVTIINLFTLSFADFLEKIVKKTVWIWLPIHAFKRLSKEFMEKYLK